MWNFVTKYCRVFNMRFFFNSHGAHRDLHSFPTRRSSDLDEEPKKRVIHGLEDVLPQPEDSSARLEDKVRLLRALAAHVDAESRSEEHTSELQSLTNLVCRLLLEKKKN